MQRTALRNRASIPADLPFSSLRKEGPVLAISREEAKKGKCTECLACELACEFQGNGAIFIDLPIPGLDNIQREGAA